MDDAKTFVQFLKNLVVEKVEDQIPLERLLAAHRTVQGEKLRKMADSATTVGEMANELSVSLGQEKAVLATLLDRAKKERARFATREEAEKDAGFVELCTEIAESRETINELEEMVRDSFSDKQEAIKMINKQSDDLARLARQDASLVRREKMVGLREEQQAMRENILKVFPEDRSDVRERASKKIDKRENRLKSRKEVIDAMWAHQNSGKPVEVAPDAKNVMDEIENGLKK